jgi:hypothetical protein
MWDKHWSPIMCPLALKYCTSSFRELSVLPLPHPLYILLIYGTVAQRGGPRTSSTKTTLVTPSIAKHCEAPLIILSLTRRKLHNA